MSTENRSLQGIDRDALMRVLDPIALAHGVEVFDVEFRPESQGWILRIYVEKKGAGALGLSSRDAAVDLEMCAGVSRDLSTALDIADLVPRAYRLEVSSPGLDRPLRDERDYARFAGQKAKVKLREPISGAAHRVLVGTLAGVAEQRLNIREGGKSYEVPLSNIESARLVFEFGEARSGAGQRETHQRKH